MSSKFDETIQAGEIENEAIKDGVKIGTGFFSGPGITNKPVEYVGLLSVKAVSNLDQWRKSNVKLQPFEDRERPIPSKMEFQEPPRKIQVTKRCSWVSGFHKIQATFGRMEECPMSLTEVYQPQTVLIRQFNTGLKTQGCDLCNEPPPTQLYIQTM